MQVGDVLTRSRATSTATSTAADERADRSGRATPSLAPVLGVVASAGFAARLALVLLSGGLGGQASYDPGVYYAAADALVHGRAPYRDFTLVHPPGIALAWSPFALLGRLTTDHTGFMVAMLAAMLVGAVNAALVSAIVARLGCGRRAALIGGLFYALCWASVASEFTTRLEPVGNMLLLLGVLGHVSRSRARPGLLAFATGAALAAAVSTKIWYVVPVLVVLALSLMERRGGRHVAYLFGGVVAAGVVIDGPFFALAPGEMWRSVVVAQLMRPRSVVTTTRRLGQMSGLTLTRTPSVVMTAGVVLLCVTAVVLVALVWRRRAARVIAVVFVAEVAMLLASPTWYSFYADYLMTGAALVVGVAASRRPDPAPASNGRAPAVVRGRLRAGLGIVGALTAATVTLSIEVVNPVRATASSLVSALGPVVGGARCIQADTPMPLIQLDVLSRDLRNGCPQWVDVTGRTYGVDRQLLPSGQPVERRSNARWQRDLLHYFGSADLVILSQPHLTGFSPATFRAITRGGLIARYGHVAVYGPPHLT